MQNLMHLDGFNFFVENPVRSSGMQLGMLHDRMSSDDRFV